MTNEQWTIVLKTLQGALDEQLDKVIAAYSVDDDDEEAADEQ